MKPVRFLTKPSILVVKVAYWEERKKWVAGLFASNILWKWKLR
jgi:hypothetical protein